jgi:hypothetical protein
MPLVGGNSTHIIISMCFFNDGIIRVTTFTQDGPKFKFKKNKTFGFLSHTNELGAAGMVGQLTHHIDHGCHLKYII